ncbi:hypothetical protein CPB83DRAFT_856900 [Crepidotus variabilis]|uniref:Sulphur transport domain-containing protein n=1 Tax=Crepidotus variabilis TaxID=179855 RepID=A0A9P6ED82_9AGAR|nr:hypothetical protein CPB83DRAFT_856900 [Crepidotus variabilis]
MVLPSVLSTPLQSLLGGLGVALSAHELLILNGSVFGISGFVNRAAKGNREALAGVLGLIAGGALVSFANGSNAPARLSISLCKAIISGFLVGVGTKLSNGCTSGHMICGLSRLSTRSFTASATFFTTAVVTANSLYRRDSHLPEIVGSDWTLPPTSAILVCMQLAVLPALGLVYHSARRVTPQPVSDNSDNKTESSAHTPLLRTSSATNNLTLLRLCASFLTSLQFSLALSLSGLSQATRVLGFLLFPQRFILPNLPTFSNSFNINRFDPSLFFVAITAVPLGILLYRFARRCGDKREHAVLGGAEKWAIPPPNGKVDMKLIIGSAIFGVGWGVAGICPGPGLINLGATIATKGVGFPPIATWLSAMIVGGYLTTL